MPDRRVAITGLGVVTSAGIGAEALWAALSEGRQCITALQSFDPAAFPCRVAGEIADFSARKFVPKSYRKAVKVMARDIEIAVAAADLAVGDAGLTTRAQDAENMTVAPARFGCNIGAGLICADLNELGEAAVTAVVDGKFDLKVWGREGLGNLTPLWLLKYLPNMLSCHVTIIHGCEGPSNAITCGAASGHLSIGEGGRWIQRGSAEAVLAGGAESKLEPIRLLRQCLLGRVCAIDDADGVTAFRPFDADHAGTVIGEGGGVVVLEEMDHARRREARVYAELVGFGAACDPAGIDLAHPTVGGLDLAVTAALRDAGISPEQVGLIVTHGTAVASEDCQEVEAWSRVMDGRLDGIPAACVTGAIGSLFAGAGSVELAAAAMALHTQTVPATVNYRTPASPGLDLCDRARPGEFDYAVTGAFSIGGQSAACVLKRCER